MNKFVLYTLHHGVLGKQCYRTAGAMATAVKKLKHGSVDGGIVDGKYYITAKQFLIALENAKKGKK